MLSNPWPSWLCLHKKSRNVTKGIKMATLMTSWSTLVFQSQNNHKKLQQHQSYHWYSCLYNRMSESGKNPVKKTHTLFEIFIFCPKIQLWFPEKIADFLGGEKLVKNVVVLDYLAVDNFDFPRKLSIFLGEKLVKMLWFWTFSLKIYELLIVNSCF